VLETFEDVFSLLEVGFFRLKNKYPIANTIITIVAPAVTPSIGKGKILK